MKIKAFGTVRSRVGTGKEMKTIAVKFGDHYHVLIQSSDENCFVTGAKEIWEGGRLIGIESDTNGGGRWKPASRDQVQSLCETGGSVVELQHVRFERGTTMEVYKPTYVSYNTIPSDF